MSRSIVYPDADRDMADLLTGARLARLETCGALTLHRGQPADGDDYLARIGDAEAIILGWGMPAAVLEGAPNLKIVSFTGIGVGDYLDLALARRRGITVSNTPGYADNTVAEHALALMLAAARHLPRLDRALRAGTWEQSLPGVELKGRRLGIVGFGGIARRLVELAGGIGMEVVIWTRDPEGRELPHPAARFASFEEVLGDSDVLSLNIALTPETQGLLGIEALARLKPGAILVNTSRGGLIDETALLAALDSGRLAAAALDVFSVEPLPADHPLLLRENVVLSPHVAYNTPEANAAICDIAIDNILAYFEGRPINVVT